MDFLGTLGSCSAGISCFKCTIAPLRRTRNETIRICSKFEENSHYQIYCPNSTMCMKRTIHHKLVNGSKITFFHHIFLFQLFISLSTAHSHTCKHPHCLLFIIKVSVWFVY